MAFETADRVKETTTTTGTGNLTLAGAVGGFQSFDDALSASATCPYIVTNGTDWEVGLGTFTSPATLARTAVLASSNADAAVNWGAGTKIVSITLPAAYAVLTQLAAVAFAGSVQAGTSLIADTIAEKTAAVGVTIDGLLIKDGDVGPNGVPTAALEDDAVTLAKIAHGTRGGHLTYTGATGAPTDSGVGTDGHVWTTGGAGVNAGWEAPATGVFSSRFVSNAQTTDDGDGDAVSHSLGGAPILAHGILRCTSTDHGYAASDEVWVSSFDGAGSNFGLSIWTSTTQIGYRVGTTGIRMPNKSTGSVTNIDPAKWSLYLVAVK